MEKLDFPSSGLRRVSLQIQWQNHPKRLLYFPPFAGRRKNFPQSVTAIYEISWLPRPGRSWRAGSLYQSPHNHYASLSEIRGQRSHFRPFIQTAGNSEQFSLSHQLRRHSLSIGREKFHFPKSIWAPKRTDPLFCASVRVMCCSNPTYQYDIRRNHCTYHCFFNQYMEAKFAKQRCPHKPAQYGSWEGWLQVELSRYLDKQEIIFQCEITFERTNQRADFTFGGFYDEMSEKRESGQSFLTRTDEDQPKAHTTGNVVIQLAPSREFICNKRNTLPVHLIQLGNEVISSFHHYMDTL